MKDAKRAIAFMDLLHAFQRVERVVHVPQKERMENDVEHSYLLAMLGWYLVETLDLPLKRSLVIEYALAHDLVEVYAGDTYIFTKDEEAKRTKRERERAAQLRIQKELPEFESLHHAIERYETQADEESRFVYALDKLIPLITIYLEDGRTWKEMEVAFNELMDFKREKIGNQPQIRKLLEEIIALIEKDRKRYFDK